MEAAFSSSGWRRRGLAALLGMLATCALPPLFILPLLIPAFSGLFLLTLHAPKPRQAFMDGWWWGLGHFSAGLYWICISLYVEPEKFAWLTPFALFGLPSIIGIYTGITTMLLFYCRKITTRPTLLLPVFTLLWISIEYLRSHLFTGFPWNLIGYVWNASDASLQPVAFWGIYGQSALAVSLATLPALVILKTPRAVMLNLLGYSLLGLIIAGGASRLATHPTQYTSTQLRIIQGNITQSQKLDRNSTMQALKTHVDLTRTEGLDSIDMVIWPETAVPYMIETDSPLTRDLGSILHGKTVLFTGGLRGVENDHHWQAWNSAFVINAQGNVAAQYDKHHLVPFGEFIPLRHVLPLDNIAGGMGDFSRGSGPSTLMVNNIPPFSPLICYEAIFPDEATDSNNRAEWLINITNDAWFGISSGPFQHFEMARTRAVENGLPLIRAANTGMSAIIDAYGRVLQRLPLNETGIINSKLPSPSINTIRN